MSGLNVLVCGGRDYRDHAAMWAFLDQYARDNSIGSIMHGAAPGADLMAGRWAREHGVIERQFPADWNAHGRAAGPIRNRRMLDEGKPDVVIAFPGGKGTADMKAQAAAHGVPVHEVKPGEGNG